MNFELGFISAVVNLSGHPRTCSAQVATALISLPSIWFLPLKWSFGVSDALHKSLPMAKVCCWFWEMHLGSKH